MVLLSDSGLLMGFFAQSSPSNHVNIFGCVCISSLLKLVVWSLLQKSPLADCSTTVHYSYKRVGFLLWESCLVQGQLACGVKGGP